MAILKPFKNLEKPQDKEARLKAHEKTANDELKAFIDELQAKHNVRVTPTMLLGVDPIRGVRCLTDNIECVSNDRFKK
jgi:hypothetical protein